MRDIQRYKRLLFFQFASLLNFIETPYVRNNRVYMLGRLGHIASSIATLPLRPWWHLVLLRSTLGQSFWQRWKVVAIYL